MDRQSTCQCFFNSRLWGMNDKRRGFLYEKRGDADIESASIRFLLNNRSRRHRGDGDGDNSC